MAGTYSNWVKIIAINSAGLQDIDSSAEVYNQFNSNNALIYDYEAKVLYFLDSESNGGVAQKINATTECPLYLVGGDGTTLTYNGSSEISVDSSFFHEKYDIDPESLKSGYDVSTGTLNCPLLTIDAAGHIIETSYVNLTLAGDSDSSLVTVAKTKVLFAEYASKFEVKVCGKGTSVGYIIPDTTTTGTSYKCIDGHEYYYSDGTTKITYTDEGGNVKNPGAGDIIIADKVSPMHWNVVVNKYDLYSDVVTGLVPAYGDSSNAILYAENGWGYLDGSKGIEIIGNKTIQHTNDISAGTIGQQHDHDGSPSDEIFIPHCVSTAADNPYFIVSVPKIKFDAEGHITSVIDSSVTIEVSKIVGGDYPYLNIQYVKGFNDASVTYDPNGSDKSIDLRTIRAATAVDSSKLSGKTATSEYSSIISQTDTTIPTSGAVSKYVINYIEANTDEELSTTSTNAVQNKVIYNEILTRDACVYERIDEERQKTDASIITLALKENVIEKDSSTEYTPTGDYNPATKLYVDSADASLRAEKQDKLTPGPGVVIDGSTIKFSADIFIVIDGYVLKNESDDYRREIGLKITDPVEDKIYLWRLYDASEGSTSTPTYLEFSYDFNSSPAQWVELGRFRLDFLIDNRLKDIDSSISWLRNEQHVFLTEDQYSALVWKDPEKIYFTYEDEGEEELIADVSGNTLYLSGDGASVVNNTLYIVDPSVKVENNTLIL